MIWYDLILWYDMVKSYYLRQNFLWVHTTQLVNTLPFNFNNNPNGSYPEHCQLDKNHMLLLSYFSYNSLFTICHFYSAAVARYCDHSKLICMCFCLFLWYVYLVYICIYVYSADSCGIGAVPESTTTGAIDKYSLPWTKTCLSWSNSASACTLCQEVSDLH